MDLFEGVIAVNNHRLPGLLSQKKRNYFPVNDLSLLGLGSHISYEVDKRHNVSLGMINNKLIAIIPRHLLLWILLCSKFGELNFMCTCTQGHTRTHTHECTHTYTNQHVFFSK